MEINEKLLTRNLVMHLNGGSEFNYSTYTIKYGESVIGEMQSGRRNKNEKFCEAFIGEDVFSLPEEKDKMIEAVKLKLEKAA